MSNHHGKMDYKIKRKPLKVLIIGDANSLWIKTIIEYTHIPYGDQVTVLTLSKNDAFNDYYDKNNIKVNIFKRIKTCRAPLNILYNMHYVMQPFDLVTVHYVQKKTAILACIGKMFSKKMILAFWGSDILRAEKSMAVEFALKMSSNMVISTKEMQGKFRNMYGSKYDNKINVLNFGSKGIELLNDKLGKIEKLKGKYNIANDKIVLSIGYNRSYSQQHLKIVEVIATLSEEIRRKIHIILRLTYGDGDNEYISKIKRYVNRLGCTNSIFDSFLTDEEISEITALTDVFVHAQITDARSAAMCEHLYAGALVVVPSWIHYDIEDKVFYLKYDTFEKLGYILENNMTKKNNNEFREHLLANKDSVYEILSWDIHAPRWRNLYYL